MSYIFDTQVCDIPCQCQVTYYYPGSPMIIVGSGFGDAIEPEPEVFEFNMLDSFGNQTHEFDESLTDATYERLKSEYLQAVAMNSDAD